jgi:hypothetical protein
MHAHELPRESRCDCLFPQDNYVPRVYTAAVLIALGYNVKEAFDTAYCESQVNTAYYQYVRPVNTDNLRSDPTLLPSARRRASGRPKVRRLRWRQRLAGEGGRADRRCSICNERGYNRLTCPRTRQGALENYGILALRGPRTARWMENEYE